MAPVRVKDPDPRLGLVLGGAECVWRDLAALERMIGRAWPGVVLAVNDVGCRWTRPLDHWATLHPDKFSTINGWRNPNGEGPHGWVALRAQRGYPPPGTLWSHVGKNSKAPAPRKVIKTWGGGASGLLGPAVLYQEGCARVVLCGVPMDNRPHFDQSTVHKRGRGWDSVDGHRRAWVRVKDRLRERTRSMSGWTRLDSGLGLGAPDLEWFGEYLEAA